MQITLDINPTTIQGIDANCGRRDDEFVIGLVWDILERYFHPEYYDDAAASEYADQEDAASISTIRI